MPDHCPPIVLARQLLNKRVQEAKESLFVVGLADAGASVKTTASAALQGVEFSPPTCTDPDAPVQNPLIGCRTTFLEMCQASVVVPAARQMNLGFWFCCGIICHRLALYLCHPVCRDRRRRCSADESSPHYPSTIEIAPRLEIPCSPNEPMRDRCASAPLLTQHKHQTRPQFTGSKEQFPYTASYHPVQLLIEADGESAQHKGMALVHCRSNAPFSHSLMLILPSS